VNGAVKRQSSRGIAWEDTLITAISMGQ